MDLVTALAIVIGVMGGIATWLVVTIGSPYLLIWAMFIGWACFFHCGGKEEGLKNSAIANVWGVLCAAVGLIVALSMGLTAATAGLLVGITVAIMIFGAKVPALGAIPASVYGYASAAAFILHGGALTAGTTGAIAQAAVGVAVSLIIGNVLGYISEKVAGALVSKRAAA